MNENIEQEAVKKKTKCPICKYPISMDTIKCENCGFEFPSEDDKNLRIKILTEINFNKKETEKKEKKLVDFQDVEKNLDKKNQHFIGIKPIPLKKIVGSFGRYNDFNSEFLPVDGFTTDKLQPIVKAIQKGKEMPPIEVYEINDKYFVVDGHHRVSAYLLLGEREYIDAEITKVDYKEFLLKNKKYHYKSNYEKKFILEIEKKSFQKKTYLYNDILVYPIRVTELGSYSKIYQEIMDYHNSIIQSNQTISFVMSSLEWYRIRFLPIIKLIIDNDFLEKFPKRTFTDMYVWLLIHRNFLSNKFHRDMDINSTAEDFVKTHGKINYFKSTLKFLKKSVDVILQHD